MEFPDLGKHCSLPSCKQLDYLPVSCDSCQGIYCTEHMSYAAHNCKYSHMKDRKVPVCPLCNQPISINPTENLDVKVNEHIENYCKSDLATKKRKTYTNSCSKKGCKQREIVPVLCELCRRNYCLRHRHENDHDCPVKNGYATTSRNQSTNRSSASVMASAAASSRNSTKNTAKRAAQSVLQKPANHRPQATQASRSQSVQPQHGIMSESEALSRAIQASLNENKGTSSQQPNTQMDHNGATLSQEEEDRILAEVIAQSERDERERQRQNDQNHQRQSQSNCTMS